MRRCSLLGVFVFLSVVSAPAFAQLNLVDEDAFRLDLGAYVSSFSAYQRIPYDTGGLAPRAFGINASLLRLEWRAQLFSDITFDVHNRFFWTALTNEQGSRGLGLGATVPPERTVDLQSTFLDGEGLYFEHDLDRLSLTFFTSFADFTLGRQAVTWGNSSIFTVADLWTQFSPFELDTSQKRGVDALRAMMYPAGFELEVIAVDRGELDDLSGGVRLSRTMGIGDYYVGLAKNYERLWTLLGVALDLDVVRGHAEVALPIEIGLSDEDSGVGLPRATVGADWFASSKFTLIAEYHFNGPGASDPSDYLAELQKPAVSRGERYFIGQHYAGLAAAYLPFEDTLTLSMSTIGNLTDPSVLVAPSLAYDLSQNTTATLGGYFGFGGYPELQTDPLSPFPTGLETKSEYGLYGNVFFLQLSGYF